MSRTRGSSFVFCVAISLAMGMPPVAKAALTPILDSPDLNNEPNLVGVNPFADNPNPSILETVYGESNLRRVDDSLDLTFRHIGAQAVLKAVARFNNPSIEDKIGYVDPVSGSIHNVLQFQRVPPNFVFPVGYNPPTLGTGLIPLADSGPVFELGTRTRVTSNPVRNDLGQDKLVTFEIIGTAGHPSNQLGNYVLGWEYFADNDFQDGVFELSGAVPVPEPACSLWIGAALVWVSLARGTVVRTRCAEM